MIPLVLRGSLGFFEVTTTFSHVVEFNILHRTHSKYTKTPVTVGPLWGPTMTPDFGNGDSRAPLSMQPHSCAPPPHAWPRDPRNSKEMIGFWALRLKVSKCFMTRLTHTPRPVLQHKYHWRRNEPSHPSRNTEPQAHQRRISPWAIKCDNTL